MAEHLSIKKSPIECVLECPLCLHQLTHPLTLGQCLHSYCGSCLDKVPQKTQDGRQGWLCPMCENFTQCDQIQQNTFLEELQKIQTEPEHDCKNTCEQCLDDCGEATWKCVECKISLCENGKAVHLKIPMLKLHKIVPLDIAGENLIDNIVYCKLHDDIPAQFNCCDCEQLMCYKCITTDHQEHRPETVEQALERILPETESSVRQIEENIGIIETQIESVKKEIERTKESYASCRMQMDDHLEKVICQMRAMKAKMEEDVIEQESIALDTLKDIKKQLEKQLSQSRIISNLTAVVTTKTKHTRQLQQLQNGLFKKVKYAGEVKSQSISFNVPIANFIGGLQEEIDNAFGKIGFDTKEQMINITGVNCTKPNQFLCSDFNELAVTKFRKGKEIVVEADWCNHLSYFDNLIWLPLGGRNKINIYDEDGELINVIDTGDKAIAVVKEAQNGDIICAGDRGVFVTDKQFSQWSMLSEGKFSDVVFDKDQFITLQYDEPSVQFFNRLKAGSKGRDSLWHKCHSFSLPEEVNVNSNSIICIVDKQYLLISSSSREAKGLYKFTRGGKHIDSCKDLPFYPIICGNDKNNQVFIADFINGPMYLFKPLSENEIQRTEILSAVQTPQTRSVVIDHNYNFWILTGNRDHGFKLINFASQK